MNNRANGTQGHAEKLLPEIYSMEFRLPELL